MAKKKMLDNLIIENCDRLLFRNFGGGPTKFNPQGGVRSFCVPLGMEEGEAMARDGWNVKYLKPRDEDDEPQAYMQVKVNLTGDRPAQLVMITGGGRNTLVPELGSLFDYADILSVDMIINPYHYDFNGNEGVSAYLKSMYLTVREDELQRKYANVPEIGQGAIEMVSKPLQIEEDFPGRIYEGEIED